MQRNAELNRLCMDWLCFANRAVWNSLTASLTLPLPQRLAQQLLGLMQGWGERAQRGVRIATKVSHEDLAEMLGATRQRIHQIMHEWEAEGIVGRDKPYILVLKKREITRMAGISL
jgi:CRP-like cAMP-binding protein